MSFYKGLSLIFVFIGLIGFMFKVDSIPLLLAGVVYAIMDWDGRHDRRIIVINMTTIKEK